jgi:Transposase DDE domain group 1
MVQTECTRQMELFEVGRQMVTVDFEGGDVVTDTGLLPIRQLDVELGILAEAARRLPDPRSELFVTHRVDRLLAQQVYQILAGYPDGNDAQLTRNDPLFKTLVGSAPTAKDAPLASGSTLNRFLHAYTRREAEKPPEERDVLFERRAAQLQRIRGLNEFLVDVFVRTRRQPPAHVIIDLDPTDDPTHGQQQLTFWHGYYDQHQYFPFLALEGETGMPLAAWLRPGKAHGACGAVDILQEVVTRLRQHWPDVTILVRGDHGVAVPAMYEYCEAEGLLYAFGYATNAVLKRSTAERAWHAELLWWLYREPYQSFETIEDYQAESWSRPRRIVSKVEITATGQLNRRFVVTNLSGHPQGIYRDFYTQRGNVPERPIGELKNGLAMDRLSSPRFLANAQKLLIHVLAYLLWALFREANADTPELARAEVGATRPKLFKVGAVVKVTHRRIWFHLASHWPGRSLLARASAAVSGFVTQLLERWREQNLFVQGRWYDPCNRHRIRFAPHTPK